MTSRAQKPLLIEPKTVCALGSLYNGESPDFFLECLKSLETQTVKIDLFLVIDGPITQELEIILERIKIFKSIFRTNKNIGLANALNFGLQRIPSEYKFIVRFDTDDVNYPNRFEILLNNFQPGIDAVLGTEMDEFDGKRALPSKCIPIEPLMIQKSIFKRNPINHPTVMFDREIITTIGGYENYKSFEDWHLWLKIVAANKPIRNLTQPTLNFRRNLRTMNRRRGYQYVCSEWKFMQAIIMLFPAKKAQIRFWFSLRLITRFLPVYLFSITYNLTRKGSSQHKPFLNSLSRL